MAEITNKGALYFKIYFGKNKDEMVIRTSWIFKKPIYLTKKKRDVSSGQAEIIPGGGSAKDYPPLTTLKAK